MTMVKTMRTGSIINLFPEWSDERFPLYVYYASRSHVPAKVRKFIEFILNSLSTDIEAASSFDAPDKCNALRATAMR
jgi:DNA-binding transcriptional LysR family regulator